MHVSPQGGVPPIQGSALEAKQFPPPSKTTATLVVKCKQRQYNAVLAALQFLNPILSEAGASPTPGPACCDSAAAEALPALAALRSLMVGVPCTLGHAGPLSSIHLRALADPHSSQLLLSHFRPTEGSVRGACGGALYAVPSAVKRQLWTPAIEDRFITHLRQLRAEEGISCSPPLNREGYLCEAGLYALDVFTNGPEVADSTAAAAWARVVDPYTLAFPDRSHIHELENLPQEVAIGEILQGVVASIRQREPSFEICSLIDVGGGNGFLAAEVGENLGCDSLVIDPYFPTHAIDCRPRCWPDTPDRVRPATVRKHITRRCMTFFKNIVWDRDVRTCPSRTALVAKHLCGTAVDECLRHLDTMSCLPRILILAPCCFNKGVYADYIDPPYLREVLHVDSPVAFKHMTRLTDWNRSVHQLATNKVKPHSLKSVSHLVAATEIIAMTVEAYLNHGRMAWLQARGYKVQLEEYVPNCVTPKNKCIVAYLL